MDMYKNYFDKCKVNENKLVQYGFIKNKNLYIYNKRMNISNFKIIISLDIKENNLDIKIIDLDINEEYINYKISEQVGTFVGSVRNECESILQDIKEKYFDNKLFISDQASRLSEKIYNKYKDEIEFPWSNTTANVNDGIFRNKISKKWYVLIMTILKSKIDENIDEDYLVNVLNIKLDEDEITYLVENKDGFFRAYHMNKKKWISIILDETIDDKVIMELINKSYLFSLKK